MRVPAMLAAWRGLAGLGKGVGETVEGVRGHVLTDRLADCTECTVVVGWGHYGTGELDVDMTACYDEW